MDLSSPTPEQIALALAIVKSKPAHFTIREYILQIRQNIKPSNNAEISRSPEKYFDSVSFWKQAYEKSEAEQSKLLDQNFELKQRHDALLMRKNAPEDPPETAALESSKQKITRSQTARKRTKTQLDQTANSSAADAQAFQSDSLTKSIGPFMRQFFTLQTILQKRPSNTNVVKAAVALCISCTDEIAGALPKETSYAFQTRSKKAALTLTRSQLSELETVLHAVEAAVSPLLRALKKLCGDGNPGQEANLLTYHVVCLFGAILKMLEQYCRIRTKTNVKPDTQFKRDDKGAIQLASTLNRLVKLLDLTCAGHQNLLEGFLYTLLCRAGKVLCLFTFQDLLLRPDLRMSSDSLSLPAGLVDVKMDDTLLSATQMESKYLIWLQEKALVFLDNCPSVCDSAACGSRDQFICRIKGRLQNTLAQAIYGADENYGPSLKCAVQPDFEIGRLSEDYPSPGLSIPEWYMQEMWRFLGWEVLMHSKGS
ncbi:hypothetical protein BJX99DRAFT_261812 [Aspergillus californicus]